MVLLATEKPTPFQVEEIRSLSSEVDLESLYSVCAEHELASVVYPKLAEVCSEELSQSWINNYQETRERVGFYLRTLTKFSNQLHQRGIPIVALKNGGIALSMVTDSGKCPMGDIDILVEKRDFMAVHKELIEFGFKFRFRSDYEEEDLGKAFIDGGTEYFYKMPDGGKMWLEMSWRPIAGRWIRYDKEPKSDDLVVNSIKLSNNGLRILAPEDNLLQVAVHTAKHTYVREPGFRLHLDVDRVVKHAGINWTLFLDKVNRTSVRTAVYYSLLIPSVVFGTPVPGYVLEELKPGRVKNWIIERMLNKAGLLHPTTKKFSRAEFLVIQALIYDNITDLVRVLFPGLQFMKDKYLFRFTLLYPFYCTLHLLDLAGFRRKKKVR